MKEKSDLGDERATRADHRRLARILIGIQILMALALVIMLVASRVIGSIDEFDPFAIFFVAILGIYSVVGYVVAARQPENPIGLLLCAVGPLWLVSELGDAYAQLRLDGKPLPGAVWASWAGNWVWVPAMGLIGIFLLLLFPNGRLLSRRWRPVFWAGVLGTLLAAVSVAFEPDPLEGGFTNPLVATGTLADVISNMGFPIFLLSLLAAATSLIFRLRASSGEERQQMKWLIYPAALVGPLLILAAVAEGFLGGCSDNCGTWEVIGAIGWLGMLGMVLFGFPIAMGIAILKYRLYDIDVVINKTLVFGALAAFITAVYVAVVVGIGALLGSSNEPNLGLSIAATAIVAIAFQPVKDRVERVANRLVYGIRRTPYEVLADFSDKVATSYETQEVTPAMARTLKEATGAARAEVWLALDSTLVLSASTEEGRGGDDVIVLDGGGIDAIAGADEVAAVTHQQELLGALAIAKERGEPVTSADRRLLSDLAAQAGIVLRNARLTAELQARLDEISMRAEQIRESRGRIVAAQDRARRRLERDIHDGAQQHLVALAVKLNLAKTMTERKPERAAAMLDQLETEMGDALETLNDLARGIYPALLKDKGIAAALEARAASAPFELTVVDRSSGRADEATEAAIYFCCLEALQNVAKYAGASTVVVEIDDLDGLGFSVTDDGSGFDPGAVIDGSGLQGMADRLAAVGGVVELRSQPGRGTTVVGRLRMSSRAVLESSA